VAFVLGQHVPLDRADTRRAGKEAGPPRRALSRDGQRAACSGSSPAAASRRIGFGLHSSARPNSASTSVSVGAIYLVRDDDDAVQIVVIADTERANHEIRFAERLESKLVAGRQLARALELNEHPAEEKRQRRDLEPSRP